MKFILFVCVILSFTEILFADSENLFKSGDAEDVKMAKQWIGNVKRVIDDKHSGKAAMQLFGNCTSYSQLVKIDKTKTYELSGWFKSKNADHLSRMLLDIRFYTIDKKPIRPMSIRPFSSVSELAANAIKGELKVKVKKKDWSSKMKLVGIVFNAKEDLSDIPNMEYLPVKCLKYQGDYYEFTLRKPIVKPYPEGTKVRLHRYIDYPRIWDNNLPNKWKKYSFTISAKVPQGARQQMKFWKGAEYMKVFIMNHSRKKNRKGKKLPVLLFDDIILKEINLPKN